MAGSLWEDARTIIGAALKAAQPHEAVRKALADFDAGGGGRVILAAIGKAAYAMAEAAVGILGSRISRGIIITKYGHGGEALPGIVLRESGHPMPDENTIRATEEALAMVRGLAPQDKVLLLVSGGGSSLFESPRVPLPELRDITRQLLESGADIVELNTLRKRLSNVKGGRFALACQPARVFAVVLSDIIGDPLDMIASGPAYPDSSTSRQAMDIARKYELKLSDKALKLLSEETPKELGNVETRVTGSVTQLCAAASKAAESLGYAPQVLTSSLDCVAREAGAFLAAIAREHQEGLLSRAFILGGETVVKVTGRGMGGRNQEIALAAASGIRGLKDTAVFSVGSDGTDGPTDAAGAYCDGESADRLISQGIDLQEFLNDNNAYPALKAIGGLIMTGPTGTNVNDLTVLLIRR
ncbi:MAG: DUF4147 domain-containing protein [Eubacteriales bacterium]|nr:DUF4147 domain-containing protein [Eubacteriales bacterium]